MDNPSTQMVTTLSHTAQPAVPAVGIGLLTTQSAIGATSGSLASSINTIHLLLLLRYIDAGYPPNVEAFFKLTSKNALSNDSSSTPEPFLFLRINATLYRSKWYRFGEYASTVNFLANCGTIVIMCTLFLIIGVVLDLVKRGAKPTSNLFNTIHYKFKWNLILSSVASSHSKLALAWSLQFLSPVFDLYGTINFVVAILFLVGVTALTTVSIHHAKQNWEVIREKIFLSKKTLELVEPKQKQFAFITEEYVAETSIGRYYFAISFAKVFLTVVITFWLPQAPIAQGYLLLLLNGFSIVVLLIGKPYKKTDKMLAVLLNDIIMLLQEVLLIIFATNKQKQFLSLDQGMMIGWVFIGFILLALLVNALFAVYSVVKTIIISLKNRKKNSKKTQRNQQRVISIPSHSQRVRRREPSRNNVLPRQTLNNSQAALKSEISDF